MQIPSSFAEAVIGTDDSTINYIRRTSGAIVTIQETRGVPGEMTVKITGTSSQMQTAQRLILTLLVLLITAGTVMPIKELWQLFQQRTPKIGISSLCSCVAATFDRDSSSSQVSKLLDKVLVHCLLYSFIGLSEQRKKYMVFFSLVNSLTGQSFLQLRSP